jgi:hypothetical protein
MKKILVLATLACLAYAEASAAESNVQGPRAGYIATNTGVRMILGIVGASRLGEPTAKDLRHTVVLPGSDIAVGLSPSGELTRVNLTDGATTSLGIDNVTELASSPSGEVVVALAGDTAQLISKSGSRLTSLTLPATPIRIAVADEGATIAFVTAAGSLYVVNEIGSREVFHSGDLPALAFLPNSTDLVTADELGGLYRINADLQLTKLATVSGTRALAAQPSRLLAVTEHSISAVNFGTGETTVVECSCTATSAQPLGGSNFLLTNPDDGPLWVVGAATDQLRAAFIPEAVNE